MRDIVKTSPAFTWPTQQHLPEATPASVPQRAGHSRACVYGEAIGIEIRSQNLPGALDGLGIPFQELSGGLSKVPTVFFFFIFFSLGFSVFLPVTVLFSILSFVWKTSFADLYLPFVPVVFPVGTLAPAQTGQFFRANSPPLDTIKQVGFSFVSQSAIWVFCRF